jgi:hypothetical protein
MTTEPIYLVMPTIASVSTGMPTALFGVVKMTCDLLARIKRLPELMQSNRLDAVEFLLDTEYYAVCDGLPPDSVLDTCTVRLGGYLEPFSVAWAGIDTAHSFECDVDRVRLDLLHDLVVGCGGSSSRVVVWASAAEQLQDQLKAHPEMLRGMTELLGSDWVVFEDAPYKRWHEGETGRDPYHSKPTLTAWGSRNCQPQATTREVIA